MSLDLSIWTSVLRFILRWEGGRIDHPKDRGGRTAYGIRQATYDTWRYQHGLPAQDVWQIGPADVLDIYEQHYWEASHGPALERGAPCTAFVLCDGFVNHGGFTMAKLVQEFLGGLDRDGLWGPKTWGAFGARLVMRGDATMASDLLDWRKMKYLRIVAADPEQSVFLDGWMNRLKDARRLAGLLSP